MTEIAQLFTGNSPKQTKNLPPARNNLGFLTFRSETACCPRHKPQKPTRTCRAETADIPKGVFAGVLPCPVVASRRRVIEDAVIVALRALRAITRPGFSGCLRYGCVTEAVNMGPVSRVRSSETSASNHLLMPFRSRCSACASLGFPCSYRLWRPGDSWY